MGNRLAALALLLTAASCGDNNHRDDGALLVSPRVGLYTDEAGGTATFTVRMTAPPSADVVASITSQDNAEGTVTPHVLVFDAESFATAQTVTITGVDDHFADGDSEYAVRIGTDLYGSFDVEVINGDDDTAGITVSPIVGLRTSEAGTRAMFTVRLTSQPAADVTIPLATTDATEGTIDRSALTFTMASWDIPQTVSITGVQDGITDGSIVYSIALAPATSADGAYNGLDGDDGEVPYEAADVTGVSVSPTSGLVVGESGTTATFSVVLQAPPTSTVTIPVSSSDTTEATVSTTLLVFTTSNWNTAHVVTVTGVDDVLDDGDQPFTIVLAAATSSDSTYSGVDASDVTGTTTDNDGPGATATPASGIVVSEAGTTATFWVVLQTQPSATVTIPVASADTTEATASTASLVFTTANWNTPHPVTITGVDDFIDDGDQGFTITLGAATSTDGSYSGLNPTDVTGTTTDNDVTNVTVTPATGLVTTEAGGTATFTVRLTSQPTATVTIPVSTSDPSEGTVGPASLVFDANTWNVAQTVTVTGVDDTITDGDIAYTVVLGPATSSDATYSGFNATDVGVTNTDNDVPAGFTIAPSSLIVSEFRDSDVALVSLTKQPTTNVVIGVTSTDTTEGTVNVPTLTFTPQNWNVPQMVIVTGVDDTIADGNILFSIVLAPATSADPAYNGLDPADISVTNIDNDTASVYVKSRTNQSVTEAGGSTTFRVRLTIAPTATVTCTLQSSDLTEGTVTPMTLIFTPSNYGYQTVTVTGVDDTIKDGDIVFAIVLNACTSTDLAYQGSNPRDVFIVNKDND